MVNTKIVRGVSWNNNKVWVSPNNNWWWRVHKTGSLRDSFHTDNKQDAIMNARNIAKSQRWELLIQNRDGKISERNSYGNDLFPPKG